MTGRRPKYSEQMCQDLCDVVAVTGSNLQAYNHVGIASGTFYKWLNEKSELKEAIEKAHKEYLNSRPVSQIRKAQQAVQQALDGVVIETEYEESSENAWGPVEKSGKRTVKKGVPRWVIEHVLGPPRDEFQALIVLVRAGWLPISILKFTDDEFSSLKLRFQEVFTGILPEGIGSSEASQGLSPESAEQIRQRILNPDT